jgi:L-malate glycosyltransferase
VTLGDPRPRRVRVCIVAPSLDILGGQAVVAQRLMARLREDPDIELSFIPHNPRLAGPLRSLQRVKYLRTLVTTVAYVALLLKQLRHQDVVHVFSASYWSFLLAPTPAVLIGKWYGKRVIINYRSGEAADHLARWRRSAVPVLRRADVIAVPSGYLVDVFARFGLTARSIFNFVDIERIPYRERPKLRPVFLANRNFAPHYNVACVLRAFQVIQQRIPNARLVVAGDGEQREMLHALARELELRNVDFTGQVSPERMSAMYDEADLYLNAPIIDNMPNSVIEAFAAGLSVVTTNAGGIPYIVTHGVTGLLAESNDHAALATQALRLLDEPALAHQLSINAHKELLQKYTWPAVHEAWREVYGIR